VWSRVYSCVCVPVRAKTEKKLLIKIDVNFDVHVGTRVMVNCRWEVIRFRWHLNFEPESYFRIFMLPPKVRGGGIMLSARPSIVPVVRPSTTGSRDAIYLYLVAGFQWNLPQIFSARVKIAENVFKVRGQRSRSYVYKYVNVIMAEAYISTAWHRGRLPWWIRKLPKTWNSLSDFDAVSHGNVSYLVL